MARKLKLYRIDVQVCATAYIKATSHASALTIAKELKDRAIHIDARDEPDIEISGLPYDHPMLPDVSVSPAMTCHGVWPSARVERADG